MSVFLEAYANADLLPEDLQSMRSLLAYYSIRGNSSKRERKLAKALGKALLWIERACWLQKKEA